MGKSFSLWQGKKGGAGSAQNIDNEEHVRVKQEAFNDQDRGGGGAPIHAWKKREKSLWKK